MRRGLTLFLFVIVPFAVYAQGYAPLSNKDKKSFLATSKALEAAAAEGSYDGILRFGPGVLKKYESVLLDPGSKDLRPLYMNIEKLISEVALLGAVDSFQVGIEKLINANDYYGALVKYDSYFDYLHTNKNDSLLALHKPVYRMCVEKYFDGRYETYRQLSALKYCDKKVVDSLRGIVERSFKDAFVTVSSSSIEELFRFRAQYPGIFSEDIENLIQSHKARWRLGLKRRPSIETIERYLVVFPDKDRMVDSLYHKVLYDNFVKEKDVISASKYLAHFPSGRNAKEVRMFIEILERERMMQMYMGGAVQNSTPDDVVEETAN